MSSIDLICTWAAASLVYWLMLTQCVGWCRTQLANRTSELLLTEDAPISDMVFDAQNSSLWVATAASTVKRQVQL